MEPGRIIAGKYRLERRLASGGAGVVWVARHVALDVDVAVKLLSPGRLDDVALVRFRREAQAAARLPATHVVRVHDFGMDGSRPYMAMELLEGEDLRDRLERTGPMTLPDAAHVIRQMGVALRHAHEIGLVHRDLKPGNVFIARTAGAEVVKLLDFGVAKHVEADLEEAVTATDMIVGTPAYMAPEQARGDEIDHRADLWSLAVVLLELVIGRNPFRGDDLIDTLGRIAWEPLPIPSELDPRLSPAFDAFMDRALTRATTGRFGTADELVAALDAALDGRPPPRPASPGRSGAPVSLDTSPPTKRIGRDDQTEDIHRSSGVFDPPALTDSVPPPSALPLEALSDAEQRVESPARIDHPWRTRRGPLVGRSSELDAILGAAVECQLAGSARRVQVTGRVGIGKTRLLQEVVARLAHADVPFEIWSGRADRAGARSPFALVADLLRQRLGEPADRDFFAVLHRYVVRYLPEPDAARVAGFLAEVVVGPGRVSNDPELRAARNEPRLMFDQVRRAFEELIRAHATPRPIAIVADQLHVADAASLGMLGSLIDALADRPLMLVGATREDEPNAAFDGGAGAPVMRLELDSLSADAATEMVRDLLGSGASTRAVEAIVRRGAGHPLLIEELALAGAIESGGTRSATVLAVAESRILALPASARRVLRAASVFGDSFPEPGIRELLRVDMDTLRRELALLEERFFVEPHADRCTVPASEWSFRHAALREAAYAMIPTSDRDAAHRAAAYYLEGVARAEPATIASHFDRGGRVKRAARHYVEAARLALVGSDVTSALRFGERALELLSPSEGAGALLLVAESHQARGESQKALDRSVEAMRVLPRGSPRWLVAASGAAMAAARIGKQRIPAAIARDLLEMPLPDGRARNAPAFITACARVGQILRDFTGDSREREMAHQVLARAELTPAVTEREDPIAYATLCRARAHFAHQEQDLHTGWRWLDAASRAYEMAGDRRFAAMALCSRAHMQYLAGMNHEAVEGHQRALELIGQTAPFNRAAIRENLGAALARLGRIEEAIASLREALHVQTEIGDVRAAAGTRTYLAPLLAGQATEEAFEHARRAVMDSAVQPGLTAYALGVLAGLELDYGDAVEALGHASRAFDIVAELGTIREGEAMVRLSHVRSLQRNGESAAAAAHLHKLCEYLATQASRLRDPDLQRAYWEGVPEHRDAVALARALLGSVPR